MSFGGWTHKMRLITESAELLSETVAASLTPPVLTVRGRLKISVAGVVSGHPVTIAVAGTDGGAAANDSLTFSISRDLTTDYFYDTISSLACSGQVGTETVIIKLIDGANHEVKAEVESDLIHCTFREVHAGSRIYEMFGVVDSSLFYLRCPSRIALTAISKFRVIDRVIGGTYRVCRPVRAIHVPGTNKVRELETYALEA